MAGGGLSPPSPCAGAHNLASAALILFSYKVGILTLPHVVGMDDRTGSHYGSYKCPAYCVRSGRDRHGAVRTRHSVVITPTT